jgi:hypothetical protein
MIDKDVWNSLRKAVGDTSSVYAIRLHPESKFNIFAALDQATGHRLLLLKSNIPDIRPAQSLPTGRGFIVGFVTVASDPEGANCLRFELSDPAYTEVFDVIGNDVLQNVVQSSDDKAAFNAFVSRIAEWQIFLDQLPKGGLGDQAQQGLFAELWFLREILIGEIGPRKAVSAWAGPMAFSKDFQLSGVAIEVKSSSAHQHSRFIISSEMQLDSRGVQKLFLYCLLLERLVAGGMSLVELIGAVRVELGFDPTATNRFSEMLLRSGYIESDAEHYTARFTIRSQDFFEVKGDFPRIVESDLRRGVGDVKYSILHSECKRYAISEVAARSQIRATLT